MNKVWFLTGSSRGLGRSIAQAVLEAGDTLVATARQPEALNDLQARYGGRLLALRLDVRNVGQVKLAVAEAVKNFGRIDVVVNNAGYGNVAAIEEAPEDEFRDQIETNLWGAIHVTRAVLPTMRAQKSGHIFQISSVGGRLGMPGMGAYQTAKWALEGFSEVLSKEIDGFGIKVTLVEPGHMPTDWAGTSMKVAEPGDAYRDVLAGRIELLDKLRDRSGQTPGSDPDKVARVLVNLAGTAQPPLRLLMGSASVKMVLAVDEAKIAETRRWEALSSSVDL
jgi:NAD(P)-dependent dehydrogenase (short-subunit alcohol dehydrogenase family)